MQQRFGNRRIDAGQHPDRRSVDHARHTAQRLLDAVGNACSCLAIEPGGQRRGLGAVAVENPQFADAEPGQRKGNRLADAAGADHGDGAMRGSGDEVGDGARETGRIGVVADQPVVADDDGIDGADQRGARRQFVEQIEHGFLVGKGDVDARKTQPPDALQQHLELFGSGIGDLDQLIMTMQAQRRGRPFVHRRRSRLRDRRAEQAGEKAVCGMRSGGAEFMSAP